MSTLTRIDELLLGCHRDLAADDECYTLREYTVGAGFDHSETNDLILNFKKEPKYQNTAAWKYKVTAIERLASELRDAVDADWLRSATLVPMPPSKAPGDPAHDDRMLQLLRGLSGKEKLDVRELLVQTVSMTPAHAGERPSVDDLVRCYSVEERVAKPAPKIVGVFDDILTRGTHFRAASTVLRARFGSSLRVVGIFIARAVYADEDIDELF